MDTEKIITLLNEKSKIQYYKFTYRGDGSCRICQQYNGKVFRDDEIPYTHPNCKCAKITQDPVDIAMGKYQPKLDYYVEGNDFNKNRAQIEDKYGRIIDSSKFSTPGYELADNIAKKGLKRAIFEHKILREGKKSKPYFDGKNIPTVGIGINMIANRNRLLKKNIINQSQCDMLKWWNELSLNEREKNKNRLSNALQDIRLTDEQIFLLFSEDCTDAENSAKDIICRGGWIEKTRKDGIKYKEWNESFTNNRAWAKLPELAKAICADMAFNLGKAGLKGYPSFVKAVKAGDYRRAAIELIDSADYKNNIKTSSNPRPANPGLAKRRLDAAIELTKLADEEEARKRQ
ncbi:MAG: hypothetical protein LBM70_03940 [Victivallales bacterium]|jgi:GH24 family phage-related lysozyme (muramidase)|nr:hypothetical protein [Victivallales bacterium]